jgi:methylmalonyl-CoA/ethylmalonyl-CoA epimerase
VFPPEAVFHHIGYATESVDRDAALFAAMGYTAEGDAFVDPVQGVRGLFMTGNGPRIELLENLPGADTLTPWLGRGVRMYHMAYFVPSIEDALTWAAARRGRIAVAPVPAVAFGGRRIAFVMFRHGLMLEFIEQAT